MTRTNNPSPQGRRVAVNEARSSVAEISLANRALASTGGTVEDLAFIQLGQSAARAAMGSFSAFAEARLKRSLLDCCDEGRQ